MCSCFKRSKSYYCAKRKIICCNLGNQALAKGGSGDVLSGMIAAHLGFGFSALEAAKNATLAHGLVAKNINLIKIALTL